MGFRIWSGFKEVKAWAAEIITPLQLEDVADGTWRGQVDWKLLTVTVDVTVMAGEITDIDLVEHNNGRGENAEAIIATVLDAQSLEVDVISGATLSSRAILHAIADALN